MTNKIIFLLALLLVFSPVFASPDAIKITGIASQVEVEEGQLVKVTVNVKSEALITTESANMEVCIYPDKWGGMAFNVVRPFSVVDTSTCCQANRFCSAKKVTLSPGETEAISFDVQAPSQNSMDACNNLGSAWDTSHEVVAGTYDACGSGYLNKATRNIKISASSVDPIPKCPPDCPDPGFDIFTFLRDNWPILLIIIVGILAVIYFFILPKKSGGKRK